MTTAGKRSGTSPVGKRIRYVKGSMVVPDCPIIPFIEGDGIGPEIWAATRTVIDAAVTRAYDGKRSIAWLEVLAGDKARAQTGQSLPDATLAAIKKYAVAIKGPLTTPTGGGERSLNVTMRQTLDLYRCVRPVRYFKGVPSAVVRPQDLDVVIFRENTEDVYAGIEFEMGTAKARRLRQVLAELGAKIPPDAGIGIKPVSRRASKRLVRKAIEFAIEHGRKVVTLVHKGNIQKFTEGSFCKWGYEVAVQEFRDDVVTEEELWSPKYNGTMPEGKVLVNDRIADAMFYELLVKPASYSVIATTNLNGDYLSDDTAGQVGGLGIAPGANIGDRAALFEATHGTAPRIAGKGLANPTSLILSACMLLEHIGWNDAAELVVKSLEKTIARKTVTGDLAPYIKRSKQLTTTEFGLQLVKNLPRSSSW